MGKNFINTIRLSENDNIVVARSELQIGMIVDQSQVTATELISPGHKIATELIPRGSVIRKYNQVIGTASTDIHPGNHDHIHNCKMSHFERDYFFSDAFVRSNKIQFTKFKI